MLQSGNRPHDRPPTVRPRRQRPPRWRFVPQAPRLGDAAPARSLASVTPHGRTAMSSSRPRTDSRATSPASASPAVPTSGPAARRGRRCAAPHWRTPSGSRTSPPSPWTPCLPGPRRTRRRPPNLAGAGQRRRAPYASSTTVGVLSIFVNEEDHVRSSPCAPGAGLRSALLSGGGRRLAPVPPLRYARHPVGAPDGVAFQHGNGPPGSPRSCTCRRWPCWAARADARRARQLGISIPGAHGEHSVAAGDLYQVSNAVTLGLTTDHIEGGSAR
jgi:hypothetical protein